MKLNKAILPVAGLGTRFLPATKSIPKEMLPIVDTPLVEFAVDEAVDAGIEEIIFITSHNKIAIQEHFRRNIELEQKLLDAKKDYQVERINLGKYKDIKFSFVNQEVQLGLGDAIYQAKSLIRRDEFFCVLLADDLFYSKLGVTSQLVEKFKEFGKSIIAVNKVESSDTKKYGVIDPEKLENGIYKINDIVEKPQSDPPSRLAVTGRYILSGEIMSILKDTKAGFGGEIQLTDAIKQMISSEGVFGLEYDGKKFDCGSKEGFIDANIFFAKKQNLIP